MSNSYSPAYQPIETRNLKRSPNCYFYVNGNRKFDPAKVCLSNRIKTLDGVMEELTRFLPQNHRSGGVRSIFTPRQGHRVRDLSQFIDGEYYVAAIGNDRFDPIEYREIPPRKPRHLQLTRSGYRKIDINRPIVPTKHPKDPRLRDKQGKACAQNEQVKGLRIFVHIWGHEEDPPHKINIGFKQRNRLVFIKKIISDTLFVHEDSPLYKFDYGVQKIEEVTEPSDLETNDVVLVINSSNGRVPRDFILRDIIYYTPTGKKPLVVHNVTPRNAPYYNYEPFPAPQDNRSKRNRLGKYRPLPSIGSSSKQSGPISPYSNPPNSQGGRKHNSNRGRPAKEIDYDEDRGGVYRAKPQDNSRGAKQVNETRETRTELPIDQREAEEVAEEEFPSKEKTTPIPPGTELNKKPSKEQKQDKDVKKEKKSEVKKNGKANSSNKPVVTELPPVVDEENKDNVDKNKRSPVKKEATEDKESQVAEDTFYKEDKITPKELHANTASPSKPPLSTTPPKSSQGNTRKEKMNEDSNEGKRHDQWDDSFEQADRTNNARSSTPASVREARHRDELKQQEAATRIQAGVRGRNARKDVEKKKMEKRQQDDMRREEERRRYEDEVKRKDHAATKIQAGYKGYKARRETQQARKQVSVNNESREKELNEAAVKIQSTYRGYMTRKYTHKKLKEQSVDINANKSKVDEEQNRREKDAAIKIQSSYRGYRVRKSTRADLEKRKMEKRKDESAKKIQASFRGYQVRKDVAKMRAEKLEEPIKEAHADVAKREDQAATKIQAGFKGYQARKQVKTSKKTDKNLKEDEAATKIQAAARGYHTRKTHKSNCQEPQLPDSIPQSNDDESKLNTAATKIQSAFKGYQTRKEIKSKVTCYDLEHSDLLADDIDQLPESVVSRYTHRKDHDRITFRDYNATNIQMGFRANYSRKSHLKAKSSISSLVSSNILQAAVRGFLVRKHIGNNISKNQIAEILSNKDLSNEEQTPKHGTIKAVDCLQAAVRGFITRNNLSRHVKAKSKILSVDDGDYFATLIQSLCKGYLVRNSLAPDKPNSAVSSQGPNSPMNKTKQQKLQKSYWEDSNIKMYSDKTLRLAATHIQATYFMYKTRTSMKAWKFEQSLHVEQTPYKTDEQAKAALIINEQFMKYIKRNQKKSENSNKPERPKSSVSVSKRKRDFSGKYKYGEFEETSVRSSSRLSEYVLSINERSIENGSQSKTISLENVINYNEADYMGGEVEKEGESVKEVEDEEGELSSIQRNVNAVSQLQAAFWAYRLRREISELVSGGGELIDIQKINRAVSALRKDFTLRSAKVRRLGFERSKHSSKELRRNEDPDKKTGNIEKNPYIDDNYNRFLERQRAKEEVVKRDSIAKIVQAMKQYKMRKEKQRNIKKAESALIVTNAFRKFKTRNSEFNKRQESQRAKLVLQKAFSYYKTRKTKFFNRSEESARERNNKTIMRAVPAYENRKNERENMLNTKKLEGAKTIQSAFEKYIRKKKIVQNAVKEKALLAEKALEEANQKDLKQTHICCKLQAAVKGFLFRKGAALKASQRVNSQRSNRSLHVEMHSRILLDRATELQAAFAGCQVRKVFMTLSKLVESDPNNDNNSLSQTFQRMGSLSETDDFKLRHKSIAKLQAFNKLQEQSKLQGGKETAAVVPPSFSKDKNIPLIPYRGLSLTSLTRSKTSFTVAPVTRNNFVYKSYTEPELYHKDLKKPSRIEIYIKKKVASTSIQASFRGYVTRRRFKLKTVMKRDDVRPKSGIKRPKSSKSSRVSFKLTPEEEYKAKKHEDLNDQVKQKTTAVKLEAERRKLLAGAMQLRRETEEAKQDTTSVKIQAERRKKIKAEEENESALCIQKAYRGYKVRKGLKDRRLQKYEAEYNEWKHKRINAAIAIQSSWRGYTVRKDLRDTEEKLIDEIPIGNEDSDVSLIESSHELPELIVINIGRTKSEIERAEKRYENANMIQRVVRANTMRRKMQIKMARRRLTYNIAANTIQALYRGFDTRRMVTINASATRLQTVVKAHLARENRYRILADKHMQKQRAVNYIQATYLSQKTRLEMGRVKLSRLHNKAATNIKAGFKGYLVRQEMSQRKRDLETIASTKIQASVKGWRERYKLQTKKKAATVIISAYRSYLTRYQNKVYKAKLAKVQKAANKLQACFRAYICRQETKRYIAVELERKQEQSAIKIQSAYRGYMGRKLALDRKYAKQMNEDAMYIVDLLINNAFGYIERRADSADRIQAGIEGHRTRQNITTKLRLLKDKRMKEKGDSARVIQNMVRINQGRNRVLKRRKVVMKHRASSKLQGMFLGQVTREQYKQRQIQAARNTAASLIQIVVRVQQIRNNLATAKELRLRNESATKIQALFRGYSVRQELEREHRFIASLHPPVMSPRTRSGRQLSLEVDEVLMRNARAMILFHRKATELQSAFKGHLVRKELRRRLAIKTFVNMKTPRRVVSSNQSSNEEKSAILIQKTFRGYSDRKAYKKLIAYKRIAWRAASSQIQASVRGYKLRMEEKIKLLRLKNEGKEEMLREKRETADIISYAYRGLFCKRERKMNRYEM